MEAAVDQEDFSTDGRLGGPCEYDHRSLKKCGYHSRQTFTYLLLVLAA